MDKLPPRVKLFPPHEPFNEGMLKVSEIHTIHYEESGNPKGKPVLIVHGGPGAGCSPIYRQYFDKEIYRIVMFDQRGAGKSTPPANLIDNTTDFLISDMEKLREHLYFDVSSIALLLGLFIVESYYSYSLYRLYQNDYQLVAMIIALVLLVFTLLMIFNPKLFDLKNELDEKTGTYKRKKVIWLALTEWLLYPLSILSLVPLLFLCLK